MINLEIEKYCENCPDFEPDVNKENIVLDDVGHYGLESFIHETTITCKFKYRCHEFFKRIEKECKKENKNGI